MEFDNNIIYGILLVIAYSGVGSYFVTRVTRSRADMRNEGRTLIKSNLELIEHMGKAQAALQSPERKAEFQQMLDRLMNETTARIEELNGIEDAETRDPTERYILLPPPRTIWGAITSMLFGVALYFSLGALLLIFFFLFTQQLNLFENQADQIWTAMTVGVSLGLGLVAILFRYLAFRSFVAFLEKRRHQGQAA
ncbi:MAG: hypothetical protein AAFW46_05150 [Pseudomonadota bacterium]